MRSRSCVFALVVSLFPLLSLAAVLGPEVPVSSPEPGRAYGTQVAPRVASNGSSAFAVWVTGDDLYGKIPGGGSAAIRTPSTYFGEGSSPDIASAGDGFLLAWSNDERTLVRPVAPDGSASAAREIGVPSCGDLTLEAAGSTFMLITGSPYSDCPAAITILGGGGDVIASAPVESSFETHLAGTARGDAYVIASSATSLEPSLHTTLAVRTVSSSGSVSAPVSVPMDGTPAHSLAIASNGNETLVVWGSEYGLRTQLLDASLQPSGATIPIRYDNASVEAVASAGNTFWILTRGLEGDLSLARVRGGQLEGERIPVSYTTTSGGDLAVNGSRVLAVWGEGSFATTHPFTADNGDIHVAAFDASTGAASGSSVVSLGAHGQLNPDVRFDGSDFAVVWQEAAGDSDFILFRRFGPSGEASDSAPVIVSEPLQHASMPTVAFNGSIYLVVWQEGEWDALRIMGRRLLPNAQPLETEPFVIAETGSYLLTRPRIASNGRDFLAVWTGAAVAPTHTHTSDVFARKIGPAGPPVDDVVLVSVQSSEPAQLDPDVVWDGHDYVAVWGTSFWYGGHSPTRTSILAAVLDDEGNPQERLTIAPEVSTGYVGYGVPGDSVLSPRIAWSGNVHMVVWQSSANGIVAIAMEDLATATPTGVRRRPIRRLQGFRLSEAPASSPSIAWSGSSFTVSWRETTIVEQRALTSIVAARIPERLNESMPIDRFEVRGPSQWNGSTSAVAAGNGLAMFAFARYEALEPWSGAPRVYVRLAR